jgi:hypothetical protein
MLLIRKTRKKEKNAEYLSHARRASSIGRSGSGLSPAAGQPLLLLVLLA